MSMDARSLIKAHSRAPALSQQEQPGSVNLLSSSMKSLRFSEPSFQNSLVSQLSSTHPQHRTNEPPSGGGNTTQNTNIHQSDLTDSSNLHPLNQRSNHYTGSRHMTGSTAATASRAWRDNLRTPFKSSRTDKFPSTPNVLPNRVTPGAGQTNTLNQHSNVSETPRGVAQQLMQQRYQTPNLSQTTTPDLIRRFASSGIGSSNMVTTSPKHYISPRLRHLRYCLQIDYHLAILRHLVARRVP